MSRNPIAEAVEEIEMEYRHTDMTEQEYEAALKALSSGIEDQSQEPEALAEEAYNHDY